MGLSGSRPHHQRQSAALVVSRPDKPSIAVLSFANMSGDPEQEYCILPTAWSRRSHRTFAHPLALTLEGRVRKAGLLEG